MDWLIIDSSFLCHRAFHSRKGLSDGTIFGFLTDIVSLSNRFMTTKLAFCFDSSSSLRKKVYPDYKKKNLELSAEQKEERQQFYDQVISLREEILPDIGFKNLFYQEGYEADDLIASISLFLDAKEEKHIIVSADKDLYQLLGNYTSIYNPITKVEKTEEGFTSEFQASPKQWVAIKSIAGCNSDNIAGIEGVGEITAARFLSGDLIQGKKFQAIKDNDDIWKRNRKLVKLPYPGTRSCPLKEDGISKSDWNLVVKKYGMESLVGRGI